MEQNHIVSRSRCLSYDENGIPCAMNAAWCGISEATEVTMCISTSHKSTKNILSKKAFTIKMRLYKPRKLLQVVGHTPMDRITKEGNLISTDVFSTYRDGRPIGTEEFLLLDTLTWDYDGVKI